MRPDGPWKIFQPTRRSFFVLVSFQAAKKGALGIVSRRRRRITYLGLRDAAWSYALDTWRWTAAAAGKAQCGSVGCAGERQRRSGKRMFRIGSRTFPAQGRFESFRVICASIMSVRMAVQASMQMGSAFGRVRGRGRRSRRTFIDVSLSIGSGEFCSNWSIAEMLDVL